MHRMGNRNIRNAHYVRLLLLFLALSVAAIRSEAQNNNYFIVAPQPGINAADGNVGIHPPVAYSYYGEFICTPECCDTQCITPKLPTAFQLNVPEGTGVILFPDNPGVPIDLEMGFWSNVPGPVSSYSYTISGIPSWAVIAPNAQLSGVITVSCTDPVCLVSDGIDMQFNAKGLAAGTYIANITESGSLFSGSFQIVLNVLPSGVTNPYIPPPPPVPATGPDIHAKDAEPVDLSTGLFLYGKTDLVLNDVLPAQIGRMYRPGSSTIARAFGINATDSYDIYLLNSTADFSAMDLILPDGRRIHYTRTSSGTGFSGAVLSAENSQVCTLNQ